MTTSCNGLNECNATYAGKRPPSDWHRVKVEIEGRHAWTCDYCPKCWPEAEKAFLALICGPQSS